MKTIAYAISIILLLNVGLILSPQAEENVSEMLLCSYDFSQPMIIEEDGFTKVTLTECDSYQFNPGHPLLPMVKEVHVLPFGSIVQSVTFSTKTSYRKGIDAQVTPCETPLPLHVKQSQPLYFPDETIYQQDSLYPEIPYKISMNTGIHNREHVSYLTIEYYPVQYNPYQEELFWTEHSELSISLRQGEVTFSCSDAYDLAIICPNHFVNDLQPLVNHKERYGIRTMIQTTQEIYDSYDGRDGAEQIKYCIYDLVKNLGIDYVLLVGNVNLLPMRGTAIAFYNDDTIITDIYYADVFDGDGGFSSWDTNGNDRFSEYTWSDGMIDYVDVYPDVSVGRLPCKNEKEVQTLVNKVITYEETTAQQPWFNRLILMGGDTFPGHGVIEGELVTNLIGATMSQHQFELVKLWTSTNTFNPFIINKEINEGAGFISYSGHGYEQGFGTSPPNVENRIQYYSPYLIGVFNGDKLPIIFFDACSTTKLDFNVEDALYWYPEPLARLFVFLEGDPFQLDTLFPCFSWQLVKKQNGGAIAAIGSTRVAFTGVDETGPHWGAGYMNSRFFENYEPGKTLGELFNNAQVDYLQHIGKELITLEEFNLIGDPSLRIGGFS